jgi:AcrR family transcriptional regulator
MSHREELLAAARKCLEEKGYADTTARDLVAASGTNLSSIGYHFGSREALLNVALEEAFNEYADKILAIAAPAAFDTEGRGRIRDAWIAMVEGFSDVRPLFIAFTEAMLRGVRNEELGRQLAESVQRQRAAIAAGIDAGHPDLHGHSAETIASFMMALFDGLMIQWVLDPQSVPSAADIFDAVALIMGSPPQRARSEFPPDPPTSGR